MERRLPLAKDLLNPESSILIVTIDEKEVHRLALLLTQILPGSSTQMIITVINPKGASLGRDFARVDEHLLVIYIGSAGVRSQDLDMLDDRKNVRETAHTSTGVGHPPPQCDLP